MILFIQIIEKVNIKGNLDRVGLNVLEKYGDLSEDALT